MPKRWVIALLAAAVLLPAAHAQMGGRVNPPALTAVGTRFPVPGGARFAGAQPPFVPHRAIYLGTPFLFPDYPSEPVVVQAPPQIVMVQQPAVPEVSDAVKPGPLMIEWRENRYVRVSGGENRSIPAQPDYAGAPAHPAAASTPRQELPPAILVFRDGTRQEVQEYVIANGVMYIHGGYGQDGYRTKQIQLSSLDVPATLEANQQRGAKFILPASPNEVVTRP